MHLRSRLLSRKNIIILGSVTTLTIITYHGARIWLQRNLPEILSQQLSQILEQQIRVGRVTKLSINQLTIESINIPQENGY